MGKNISTGACFLCGQSFAKNAIARHLAKCSGKVDSGGKKDKTSSGFLLLVDGKHDPGYWLYLEARVDSTFGELDDFLRQIWLECCGHMSAFCVTGKAAKLATLDMDFDDWDDFRMPGEIDMDRELGEVLEPKTVLHYEYDFGTTTALRVKAVAAREVTATPRKPIRLLARNYPPDIPCGVCEKKPAVFVDAECAYDSKGWICAKCSKERDEEMLLPVLNTPRTGACGYTGSSMVHLGEDILEKAQAVRSHAQ